MPKKAKKSKEPEIILCTVCSKPMAMKKLDGEITYDDQRGYMGVELTEDPPEQVPLCGSTCGVVLFYAKFADQILGELRTIATGMQKMTKMGDWEDT